MRANFGSNHFLNRFKKRYCLIVFSFLETEQNVSNSLNDEYTVYPARRKVGEKLFTYL
jgi:hypothetical protein